MPNTTPASITPIPPHRATATATRRVRQRLRLTNAHLKRLCNHVVWTEWEFVNILTGLPPVPPPEAPTLPREMLVQLAERRQTTCRHVDDAIALGELRVHAALTWAGLDQVRAKVDDPVLRMQVENAAYANTLYGQRYTVEPAVAIGWFLTRRELFPQCALAEHHLPIDAPMRLPAGDVDRAAAHGVGAAGMLDAPSVRAFGTTRRPPDLAGKSPSDRLNYLKSACGWSDAALADEVGAAKSTVQKHCKGKTAPRPDQRFKYAAAFAKKLERRLTVQDLFGED